MDLSKMKDDKKLELCRWYFRALSTTSNWCSLSNEHNLPLLPQLPVLCLVFCSLWCGIFNVVTYVGFAFLPFLWAVNAVWFFKEAFQRPPYDEQRQIRKYVILSGLGCTVWLVAIICWTVIFQNNRAVWGELGDKLSFIIPTGIA